MHDQCYQILHKNAEENKAQLGLNNPVAVHSGLVTTDKKKTVIKQGVLLPNTLFKVLNI